MRPKSKQRYPALPVAVRNLLALHGLEARLSRKRGPIWEVYRPRPGVPGAFGKRRKHQHLTYISGVSTLDEWVSLCGAISREERIPGKSPLLAMDFETWSPHQMSECFTWNARLQAQIQADFQSLSGLSSEMLSGSQEPGSTK